MSFMDDLGVHLGPVNVIGRGLVTPKGYISPEQRALMQKAQDECAAAQAAMSEPRNGTQRAQNDAPEGFVIDPLAGHR